MSSESQLLILGLLVIFSGFFSASETALTTISVARVKELVLKKRRGAKYLSKVKQNPHKLLIAVLIGNNIVNIGASAFAGLIFTEIYGSSGVGIATAVMTFILLIFGEIGPKSLAISHATSISLNIAWFYYYFGIFFTPLVWFFDSITKVLFKIFGEAPHTTVTEDEIKEMVKIGAAEGSINKQEREFIENVLQFNDIIVEDVMVHRTDMEAIPESFTLAEAADYAIAHSHSRLPVYGHNLDDIKGLITVKEILHYMDEHDEKTKISTLNLSHPYVVPLTQRINSLFREFQKRRTHIAIVVDERGGTEGLVTLEDLLEEIVGDIMDESDTEEDAVEKINDKTIIARGDAKVEDVYDSLKVTLHADMFETVNSVILEKLKRFPKRAEVIDFPQAKVQIFRMTGKKILSVKITKKPTLKKKSK